MLRGAHEGQLTAVTGALTAGRWGKGGRPARRWAPGRSGGREGRSRSGRPRKRRSWALEPSGGVSRAERSGLSSGFAREAAATGAAAGEGAAAVPGRAEPRNGC